MPGAAQLWVTTAAGPSPAATHTGSASRRPAGRPECPPLRSQANMPGRSRPAACGHRTATPVVSAIGEAAIALQLMPGYLQAPDRGGHPLRWRRITAGQSSALKAGTAGQLADSCPLAAARALMCGAEGKPILRHGAGQAGAIDDGFGFDPGHGAEHVSEPPGTATRTASAPERRPCLRQMSTFSERGHDAYLCTPTFRSPHRVTSVPPPNWLT
jgi:hypothetical protein